jgi:hypothetical protein
MEGCAIASNKRANALGWIMQPISYARHRFPPDVTASPRAQLGRINKAPGLCSRTWRKADLEPLFAIASRGRVSPTALLCPAKASFPRCSAPRGLSCPLTREGQDVRNREASGDRNSLSNTKFVCVSDPAHIYAVAAVARRKSRRDGCYHSPWHPECEL